MRKPLLMLSGVLACMAAGAQSCAPRAESALQQLNALRAQARACGATPMPAAGPLRWDGRLAISAQAFAEELAQRDTLSHEGQRARSLRERLGAAGYRMRLAGENLAAGPESVDEALAQWLDSPDHCANLMAAEFEDVGLACVPGAGRYGRFWVLHLGRGSAASAPAP